MKYHARFGVCILCAVLLAWAGSTKARAAPGWAAGEVIYVDASATGANDGSSWEDAFTDLQSALGDAGLLDEIWVAEGTYKPTARTDPVDPRSVTFQLEDQVAIYGGFPAGGGDGTFGARDVAAFVTHLSGDLNDDDGPYFSNRGENSYHVARASSLAGTAVLDGFTISGGYADSYPNNGGAGLYDENSALTLANLTFSENHASGDGGGIDSEDGALTLINVIISGNSANSGGGIFSGGGTVTLTNVVLSRNAAKWDGGGICSDGSSLRLINVTMSDNSAGLHGGGMLNDGSTATMANTILWGNKALLGGSQIHNTPGTVAISYSLIEGSGGSGPGWDSSLGADHGGNLDADPRFVDTAHGDLLLDPASPAVDAGDNSAVPADTTDVDRDGDTAESVPLDLAGRPRLVDVLGKLDSGNGTPPIVDMGAYEAWNVIHLPLIARGS